MTFTHALATNNYGIAKFIVATSAANGTHTTLATAMAAASSGDTILLRDSVTENVTLTAGVNIAAWNGGSLNTPSITGTLTMTTAGTCNISGIRLVTNSANLLAVTGSAASIVNLNNCYLNISNNDGISFSSSSSSAGINIYNCIGNLGTTGIKIFAHSSAGVLLINTSIISNSGASTTANTVSAGSLAIFYTTVFSPITSSGTAALGMTASSIDTSTQNVACATCGGSGSHNLNISSFSSGTASSISISNTTALNQCYINSSNTNAVTGAGTVNHNALIFPGTSQKINTTTQSGGLLKGGQTQAPSAGFIGEYISNYGSAVSITPSGTATNITSISLTAGIWDVSAIGVISCNGASTQAQMGISATSATFEGNVGDKYAQNVITYATAANTSLAVPSFRVILTATTTYYLVEQGTFSAGACSGYGRISATRVG